MQLYYVDFGRDRPPSLPRFNIEAATNLARRRGGIVRSVSDRLFEVIWYSKTLRDAFGTPTIVDNTSGLSHRKALITSSHFGGVIIEEPGYWSRLLGIA